MPTKVGPTDESLAAARPRGRLFPPNCSIFCTSGPGRVGDQIALAWVGSTIVGVGGMVTTRVNRLILLVLFALVPAATAHADLVGTVGAESCIVYNASTGQQVFFCSTDLQPTGTGIFNPFLRVNRDGNGGNDSDDTKSTYSSGFNTDASSQAVNGYNDFDDSWTSALEVGDIGMVNTPPTGDWDPAIAGSSYALFTVDINQISASGGNLISLNQMVLYDCPTNNYTDLSTCNSFFNLFGEWDADDPEYQDFINFNYRLNNGSGSGDINVYIQNDGEYAFGGPYIALLDGWGCATAGSINPPYPCSLSGIAADNDGFQEWRTVQFTGNPPGTVPEPASLLLLGSGLSAVAVAARRRRKRAQSPEPK